MKKIVFVLFILMVFGLTSQSLAAPAEPAATAETPAGPGPINIKYAPPCLLPTQLGDCPKTVNSITDYLLRFYNFAVGIVGVLALGMIVIGAIIISVSGAVDKKKEGKDMIISAIWGIVLLLGSYLILNTINPALTELKEPGGLNKIELLKYIHNIDVNINNQAAQIQFIDCNPDWLDNIDSNNWPFAIVNKDNKITGYEVFDTTGSIPSRTGNQTYVACKPVTREQMEKNTYFRCNFFTDGSDAFKDKCETAKCDDCQPLTEISIKGNNNCRLINDQMSSCVCAWSLEGATTQAFCQINTALQTKLKSLKDKLNGIDFMVVEGYPPTVYHSNYCHFNGTCVDVILSSPTCENKALFIEKATSVVLKVLDEYMIAECPGVKTDTSTGGHLHLSL